MRFQNKIKTDHWVTPEKVKLTIKEDLGLNISKMFDPCPLHSRKNGLLIKWKKNNYINPPYARGKLEQFIFKAYIEFLDGKNCYSLLPVKSDQAWFKFLLRKKFFIYFFDYRIRFSGAKLPATTPHCLVCMQ